MSQAFSLYAELTVRQNLDLHARLFRLPAETIAARVEEVAGRFELLDVLDALPADLAARPTATPVARGGDDPQAGPADPRRADLRRRSDRARRLLADDDRPVAPRAGHHLHLDPLHERGRTLRSHLADACRARAGQRQPGRPRRQARRRHAGRSLRRLSAGCLQGRRRHGGDGRRAGGASGNVDAAAKSLVRAAAPARLLAPRGARARARSDPRHARPARQRHPDVRHRLRHQHGCRGSDLRRARPRRHHDQPRLRPQHRRFALFRRAPAAPGLRRPRSPHALRRAQPGDRDPAQLRARPRARPHGGDRRLDRRRHADARRDRTELRPGHACEMAGERGAGRGRWPTSRYASATTPTSGAWWPWFRP